MAEAEENNNQNQDRQKLLQKRMQALQMEQQKRNAVKRFMTTEAYERLMNVRVSNYELYSQLLDLIISLANSNRLSSQLTEAQLNDILNRITYKPGSKIEFRHE